MEENLSKLKVEKSSENTTCATFGLFKCIWSAKKVFGTRRKALERTKRSRPLPDLLHQFTIFSKEVPSVFSKL